MSGPGQPCFNSTKLAGRRRTGRQRIAAQPSAEGTRTAGAHLRFLLPIVLVLVVLIVLDFGLVLVVGEVELVDSMGGCCCRRRLGLLRRRAAPFLAFPPFCLGRFLSSFFSFTLSFLSFFVMAQAGAAAVGCGKSAAFGAPEAFELQAGKA